MSAYKVTITYVVEAETEDDARAAAYDYLATREVEPDVRPMTEEAGQ